MAVVISSLAVRVTPCRVRSSTVTASIVYRKHKQNGRECNKPQTGNHINFVHRLSPLNFDVSWLFLIQPLNVLGGISSSLAIAVTEVFFFVMTMRKAWFLTSSFSHDNPPRIRQFSRITLYIVPKKIWPRRAR